MFAAQQEPQGPQRRVRVAEPSPIFNVCRSCCTTAHLWEPLEISNYTLATYTNEAVIRVNQDPLGRAGSRISGDDLIGKGVTTRTNVWARPLSDGSHAMVFLNALEEDANVTCNQDCFAAIGRLPGEQLSVKDLWMDTSLPDITDASFTASALLANGGHMMIKVTPSFTQV